MKGVLGLRSEGPGYVHDGWLSINYIYPINGTQIPYCTNKDCVVLSSINTVASELSNRLKTLNYN